MENMKGTKSEEEQWMVQNHVFRIYDIVYRLPPHAQSVNFELRRDNHIEYLTRSLKQLGANFSVLDANRPWLCYWIMHSIALMGDCLDDKLENDFIDFLRRCQAWVPSYSLTSDALAKSIVSLSGNTLHLLDKNGGYGGGPGQMPHLATTYAAINALVTVGGHRSLSSINRQKLYEFLLRMKDASGGFRMHDGGEVDVRACYTAISVASVLNILDDRLIQNVGDYIVSCQTYEGGIAGEPGSEAHGGYTFCGLAAMVLINEAGRLDLPALINWVVFRQGVECGFQGRTNKLVDGCYSFWQGGVAAIIQRLHLSLNEQLGLPNTFKFDCTTDSSDDSSNSDEESTASINVSCQPLHEGKLDTSSTVGMNNGYNFIKRPVGMRPLYNSIALQQYILLCAQEEAGFRDKPGKRRDHYHTCYVLSGLSVCQHSNKKDADSPPLPPDVMGLYSNLLEPLHPLYNIVLDKYYEAFEFFSRA